MKYRDVPSQRLDVLGIVQPQRARHDELIGRAHVRRIVTDVNTHPHVAQRVRGVRFTRI